MPVPISVWPEHERGQRVIAAYDDERTDAKISFGAAHVSGNRITLRLRYRRKDRIERIRESSSQLNLAIFYHYAVSSGTVAWGLHTSSRTLRDVLPVGFLLSAWQRPASRRLYIRTTSINSLHVKRGDTGSELSELVFTGWFYWLIPEMKLQKSSTVTCHKNHKVPNFEL